jgi:membrane-bound ClpP family serine protease
MRNGCRSLLPPTYGDDMSIGTGIILFVIGAILTFALNFETEVINLDLVGYLLMGAGVIVFVIGLVLAARKRQSVTTVHSGVDAASGANVTERRTSVTPDDPTV